MNTKTVYFLIISFFLCLSSFSQQKNAGIKLTSGLRTYSGFYGYVSKEDGGSEKINATLSPGFFTDFDLNFKITNRLYSILNIGYGESNTEFESFDNDNIKRNLINDRTDLNIAAGVGYIPFIIKEKHKLSVEILGGLYHSVERMQQRGFKDNDVTFGMFKFSTGYSYYILPDLSIGATYSLIGLQPKGFFNNIGITIGYGL